MKIINNILYIEFADFMLAGWKADGIKKANFRNGPYWQMIPDWADKRKVLVQYDELRNKDKEKLTAHFGNPYEYIAKQRIKQLLELDHKAESFYRDYRYAGDKYLPIEHQQKYTAAASWLNMLIKLNDDKTHIKKELNIKDITKFWLIICDIIKIDTIELPASYRRLLAKICEYKENRYSSLIDWRFGNKLSAKIGKSDVGFDKEQSQKQIALIRSVASRHQNFDAMQITTAVNTVFEKQGWPKVSRATVYNKIKENTHLSIAGSRGKRTYNNKISMQHLRKRPDFPLYYLTLDGWTVELLYQDKNTFHQRLVMVVVLDAMNNYPLGYAIGDRENTDLIKQAIRNALIHINELFGDYYQPKQLQSDHYGLKTLTPFYQAVAHLHIPAAVGNAKSKVIEPYFNYINKTYCQHFPNWSGFNVTSNKEKQPNTEFLNAIKNSFPDKEGVIAQINYFMAYERKTKVAAYIQAWKNVDECEKIAMNKMDTLLVFGQPTKYTNSITGMGLTVSINGEKIVYDSFEPAFRASQHLKFNVIYDELDLDNILVISEDNTRRFVLDRKRALPMDVHSMTKEDHEYRNQINSFNTKRMEEVISTYVADNELVQDIINNTTLDLDDFQEATLKLMFTNKRGQQKEQLQNAKGLKKIATQKQKCINKDAAQTDQAFTDDHIKFLEQNIDYNQFKD